MDAAPRQRGPYAGTPQRRASIIEVAWDVFATQGYRGGSLREISERLGFSQAGVLHHFGSKQTLLLEVLAYRERLNAPAEEPRGIQVIDYMRTVARRNSETPGAVRLFVTMSAEATDPDHPAHQFFVDHYNAALALISSALTVARQTGEVNQVLDPLGAARQMVAFLDGIQLQWLIMPEFDMLAAYDQYAHEFRAQYQVAPLASEAATAL